MSCGVIECAFKELTKSALDTFQCIKDKNSFRGITLMGKLAGGQIFSILYTDE